MKQEAIEVNRQWDACCYTVWDPNEHKQSVGSGDHQEQKSAASRKRTRPPSSGAADGANAEATGLLKSHMVVMFRPGTSQLTSAMIMADPTGFRSLAPAIASASSVFPNSIRTGPDDIPAEWAAFAQRHLLALATHRPGTDIDRGVTSSVLPRSVTNEWRALSAATPVPVVLAPLKWDKRKKRFRLVSVSDGMFATFI